jgi:hypothetical protein
MPGANWTPPEGITVSDTPPPEPVVVKPLKKMRAFISGPKDAQGRSIDPQPVPGSPIIECDGPDNIPCPKEATLPEGQFYGVAKADGTLKRFKDKRMEECLANGRTVDECTPQEDAMKKLREEIEALKAKAK